MFGFYPSESGQSLDVYALQLYALHQVLHQVLGDALRATIHKNLILLVYLRLHDFYCLHFHCCARNPSPPDSRYLAICRYRIALLRLLQVDDSR